MNNTRARQQRCIDDLIIGRAWPEGSPGARVADSIKAGRELAKQPHRIRGLHEKIKTLENP
jgi:hypothetical protein